MSYHAELEQHWQLKKELFIELHRNTMNMINNIESQLFYSKRCQHPTIKVLYGGSEKEIEKLLAELVEARESHKDAIEAAQMQINICKSFITEANKSINKISEN